MAIASLTFESVFSNIANEDSMLPDDELALEGVSVMMELAEAEEELAMLESVYSAKEALGISFEDDASNQTAPDGAAQEKKAPGKISQTLDKIKEKLIAAWNWLVKQFTKIANFFNDLFQFNAKWFIKNKDALSKAWDSTTVSTTGKLADPNLFTDFIKSCTEELADTDKFVNDISAIKESFASVGIDNAIKEAETMVEKMKEDAGKVIEKFDAKDMLAKDIISFSDAETLITRNFTKASNSLREANAKIKATYGKVNATFKAAKKATSDKSEREQISKMKKAFNLTRKITTTMFGMCNKCASLAIKTAKAVAKKAGVKEEPKSPSGESKDVENAAG